MGGGGEGRVRCWWWSASPSRIFLRFSNVTKDAEPSGLVTTLVDFHRGGTSVGSGGGGVPVVTLKTTKRKHNELLSNAAVEERCSKRDTK
ncbi:hypothetical protein GWI33_013734 [Rhynchophorus ferrugineus]|uniref:Uncharacterized protein n=1 Tax=Rhynchophorus ferrugineus TaxID=354439 RepID=A0A834I2U7_RHYFE|nr:hypothetical protein GWI33_013734 [Rhynchophorus ferrugineus]